METSFANGGQVSAGHAEPWAKPAVIPKLLRWLGREDAPLLFRPRADWAQWEWGLRFLLECMPGRFERNCRALAGLAGYSPDCPRAPRGRARGRHYEGPPGILPFSARGKEFAGPPRKAQAVRGPGLRRPGQCGPRMPPAQASPRACR